MLTKVNTFLKIFGADNGNRTHVICLGSTRSAIELHLHMEQAPRIELETPPWQGGILPLNYACMEHHARIGLAS